MIRKTLFRLLKTKKLTFARKIRVLAKPLNLEKIILEKKKNINSNEKFFPEMIKSLDNSDFQIFYQEHKKDFSEISLIYSFEKINLILKKFNSEKNLEDSKKKTFEDIYSEIEKKIKNEMENFEKEEINLLLDIYSKNEIYDLEFLKFIEKKKNFIFSDPANYLYILENLSNSVKEENNFFLYILKNFENEFFLNNNFENINRPKLILKTFEMNILKLKNLKNSFEIEKKIKKNLKNFSFDQKMALLEIYSHNVIKLPDLEILDEISFMIIENCQFLKLDGIIEIFYYVNNLQYDNENLISVLSKFFLIKFKQEIKNYGEGGEKNFEVEGDEEIEILEKDLELGLLDLKIQKNDGMVTKNNFLLKNFKNEMDLKNEEKNLNLKISETENFLYENEMDLNNIEKDSNLKISETENFLYEKKKKLYNECAYVLYTLLKLDFISDLHYSSFLEILVPEISLLSPKSLNYVLFAHSKFAYDKYSDYINNKKKYLKRSLKKILKFSDQIFEVVLPEIFLKKNLFEKKEILNLILMSKNPGLKKFSLKKKLIEISFYFLEEMKNDKDLSFEDKKIFLEICDNIKFFIYRKNQKAVLDEYEKVLIEDKDVIEKEFGLYKLDSMKLIEDENIKKII